MVKVVGIVGATGSGKSSVGRHLVTEHGFVRVSMAAPLKDMMVAFGLGETDVNGSQAHRAKPHPLLCGRSPREAMQTIGTEWGRHMIGADIWVNVMQDRIIKLAIGRPALGVVIDDIRFPNEWAMIRRLGGELWTVRRPSVEVSRTWLDRIAHEFNWHPRIHESEYHWPDAEADAVIHNDGTEDALLQTASALLSWPDPKED